LVTPSTWKIYFCLWQLFIDTFFDEKISNAESPFSAETMKPYKKNKILSVKNSMNLREDL
jgi:hypothetical protein